MQKREDAEKSLVLFRKVSGWGSPAPTHPTQPCASVQSLGDAPGAPRAAQTKGGGDMVGVLGVPFLLYSPRLSLDSPCRTWMTPRCPAWSWSAKLSC